MMEEIDDEKATVCLEELVFPWRLPSVNRRDFDIDPVDDPQIDRFEQVFEHRLTREHTRDEFKRDVAQKYINYVNAWSWRLPVWSLV